MFILNCSIITRLKTFFILFNTTQYQQNKKQKETVNNIKILCVTVTNSTSTDNTILY